MEFIDISQLGIPIQGGSRGKHELTITLGRAVEEFRKMGSASSPQEMMELLLSTLKAVTQITDMTSRAALGGGAAAAIPSAAAGGGAPPSTPVEKPLLTVNADTLVSLLLFVVIRTQLRYLQARFIYIRHFIYIDDVDNGEMGYALSTFEAVLSYLVRDSAGLRRASRRNKSLWDAAAKGDVTALKNIMEPTTDAIDDDNEDAEESRASSSRRRSSSAGWSFANRSSTTTTSRRSSSTVLSVSETFSLGSGLGHVFPFQNRGGDDEAPVDDSSTPLLIKKVKKVAMDTRSMSSGSEVSFRSRTTSIGTLGSGIEGTRPSRGCRRPKTRSASRC